MINAALNGAGMFGVACGCKSGAGPGHVRITALFPAGPGRDPMEGGGSGFQSEG